MTSEIQGRYPEREQPSKTVRLGEEFYPFQLPLKDRYGHELYSTVLLYTQILPDLRFSISAVRAGDLNYIKMEADSDRKKELTRPDNLKRVCGLSVKLSTPEGEYEAPPHAPHLGKGALSFYTFSRGEKLDKIEIWKPGDLNDSDYLKAIGATFLFNPEMQGKLPKNPRYPKAAPNEDLEAWIQMETEGDSKKAEKLREQVWNDLGLLDFFLNGPTSLAY